MYNLVEVKFMRTNFPLSFPIPFLFLLYTFIRLFLHPPLQPLNLLLDPPLLLDLAMPFVRFPAN